MNEGASKPASDAGRDERARQWRLTACVAWAAAVAAGVWSILASGPHDGDLVLAGYLASLGLGLWAQARRIRFAVAASRFTPTLAKLLLVALAVAYGLGLADLVSGGRY